MAFLFLKWNWGGMDYVKICGGSVAVMGLSELRIVTVSVTFCKVKRHLGLAGAAAVHMPGMTKQKGVAAAAREAARKPTGKFGYQERSTAEVELPPARIISKHPRDVVVGDIVWDGDSGFIVSNITTGWGRFSDGPELEYHSREGEYWRLDNDRTVVTVLRDENVLNELLDADA